MDKPDLLRVSLLKSGEHPEEDEIIISALIPLQELTTIDTIPPGSTFQTRVTVNFLLDGTVH